MGYVVEKKIISKNKNMLEEFSKLKQRVKRKLEQ
jgi:hypothetical protein